MRNTLQRIYWKTLVSAAMLLIIAAAAGCQANTPTLVPTIAIEPPAAATEAPAQEPLPTEPAAGELPAGDPGAYPVGTQPAEGDGPVAGVEPGAGGDYPIGPGAVQVIENRAVVTARLIEQSAAEDQPGYTRLRVEILETQDVEGLQNFTRDRLNQETDVLVETGQLPTLQPGENFTAQVSYRGDESGGLFFATQVEKAVP